MNSSDHTPTFMPRFNSCEAAHAFMKSIRFNPAGIEPIIPIAATVGVAHHDLNPDYVNAEWQVEVTAKLVKLPGTLAGNDRVRWPEQPGQL